MLYKFEQMIALDKRKLKRLPTHFLYNNSMPKEDRNKHLFNPDGVQPQFFFVLNFEPLKLRYQICLTLRELLRILSPIPKFITIRVG
ncbi:MAG: hypothetical protein AAF985_25650 [Bacteroidota bacterium]